MLVLLPPSEGKSAPAAGAPVELAGLAHAPALTATREATLTALERLCRGPSEVAREALGLSPGQAGEVERDAALRGAPAAPAAAVYAGVLYERLALATLPRAARERVLIASALWGVLRPDDRIPAYKLSMAARLPGLAGLPAHWRPALRAALPDEGLVVDLRSGSYAAAWRPKGATVVQVRAFTERPDGSRAAISHMVKATRGDVARILLTAPAPAPPRDARQAAELIAAAGRRVELRETRAGATLDLIEPLTAPAPA